MLQISRLPFKLKTGVYVCKADFTEKQDTSDEAMDIREGKSENIKLTLLGKIG